MDYTQIYDLWADVDLKKRTTIAVMKAASDILNEDAGTANHTERAAWANDTLADPHAAAKAMSAAVIMNATVQTWSELTTDAQRDNDVQYIVNSSIPVFAGY